MNGHDNELLTTYVANFKQLCHERAVARTHHTKIKRNKKKKGFER
jgi:hypothetical protein